MPEVEVHFAKQRTPRLLALIAILFGLPILYATGFRHGLIFDDAWMTRNPEVLTAPISIELRFRSLTTATFQVIHQLVGPDLKWQRVFNVVLHIINACLVWGLTSRLLNRAFQEEGAASSGSEGSAELTSKLRDFATLAVPIAVLLWAFSPVAVYAVQYLTQRSTLMATGFVLASLVAFLSFLQARSRLARLAWLLGVSGTYALAVLSKEHAAPAVALLLPIYVFWRRPSAKRLSTVGIALIVVATIAATAVVKHKGWIIGTATEDMVRPFLQQLDNLRPGAAGQVFVFSVINQAWLFFLYGILWILPWVGWMSIDIRPPFPLTWYSFPHLLGALLFVGLVFASVVAVIRSRGRGSLLALCFLISAILFITELAFVRLQEPFVLYRSYLWFIVLPTFWVVVLSWILNSRQWIMYIGFPLLAFFCAAAYDRIQSMRDDRAVWYDAFLKMRIDGPENAFGRWRAPHNLARWSLTDGRFTEALMYGRLADKLGAPDGLAKQKIGSALVSLRQPQEALSFLFAAQAEGYTGAELWVSIGSALDQLGRVDDAFEAYDRALKSDLHSRFRGATLIAAGNLALRTRRYEVAERYYAELLTLQRDSVHAIVGLSEAKLMKGDVAGALLILSEGIARLSAADLYHARATVYSRIGRWSDALKDNSEALARDPNNRNYLNLRRNIERALVELDTKK